MKYSFLTLFVVLVIMVTFPIVTHAVGLEQSDINVEMSPENPGPNQSVYVSLTSYITNINSATITWKINGKTQKTGKGEKSFDFTSGDTGSTVTLDITVATTDSGTINKTLKIKPSSVDLIWQNDGFVPPFYKGKALFSYQNKITFIALPHITNSSGVEISAKNLIYKWTKNGTIDDTSSGFGKNSYTVTPSLIARPLNIQVEATSPSGDGAGRGNALATPVNPSVIFYRKNPLYGIEFQRALTDTVKLQDSKEIAVIAMPFYFKINSPGIGFKWSINNSPINNGSGSNIQVFRQTEGVSGTSYISLSVENENEILQFAKGGFNLAFGQN